MAEAEEAPTRPRRRKLKVVGLWLWRIITGLWTALGVIGALSDFSGIGLIDLSFDSWDWPGRPPPTIDGSFKIAIGDLAVDHRAVPDGDRDDVDQVAKDLRDGLVTQFKARTDLSGGLVGSGSLRGNSPVGYTGGQDREELLTRQSKQLDADLIVSGIYTPQANHSTLEIEVLFFSGRSGEATELLGYVNFGKVDVGSWRNEDDSSVQAALTSAAVHASAYSSALLAVHQYQLGQYEQAETALEQVLKDVPEHDEGLRKFVYLLLGNSAGRLADKDAPDAYAEAEQRYRAALAIDPEYVRARLGLLDITYQQATPDGCPGLTPAQDRILTGTVKQYERIVAESRGPDPEVPDAGARAEYGIGRALACRYLSGRDEALAPAQARLRHVAQQYSQNPEKTWLKGWAAEAYATYGLIGWEAAESVPERAAALEQYWQAAELAPAPERREDLIAFTTEKCSESDGFAAQADVCRKACETAVTVPAVADRIGEQLSPRERERWDRFC